LSLEDVNSAEAQLSHAARGSSQARFDCGSKDEKNQPESGRSDFVARAVGQQAAPESKGAVLFELWWVDYSGLRPANRTPLPD
jgi:hypothetical protein